MFRLQCNDKQCSNWGKINITTNDSHVDMEALNNMSQDQHEFLHLHERWDHYNFDTLKILAKEGIIHKKFANVDPPVCLACKLGKALTRSCNNTLIPDTITRPGDLIHTDQVEGATPGRPMTISGKNNKIKETVFTAFVNSISKKFLSNSKHPPTLNKLFEANIALNGQQPPLMLKSNIIEQIMECSNQKNLNLI